MPTSFPMSIPHAPTGFVNQAALDTAFSIPINDLYGLVAPLIADTNWVTITLASGFVASGAVLPAYRVAGGIVYYRGYVKPSVGNFAATSVVTIAAAGAIPSGALPSTQAASEKFIPGSTAASGCRAYVGTDGHIDIVTGASTTAQVGISGLSGYIAEI